MLLNVLWSRPQTPPWAGHETMFCVCIASLWWVKWVCGAKTLFCEYIITLCCMEEVYCVCEASVLCAWIGFVSIPCAHSMWSAMWSVCGVYEIYGGGSLCVHGACHILWAYHKLIVCEESVHVTNTSIWVTKSQDCVCRRLHVSDWLICSSSTGTPSWMCLTMLHVSVSSILWIHVWQCKYVTWRGRKDLEGFVLWMTSQVYGEGVVLTERSHCVHAFLVLSNKWYLFCLANIPNWTHKEEGVHKSQLEPPVPHV